jgi:hypothetical protein
MLSIAFDPVNCDRNTCNSFLLTGGLVVTTPWPPTNYTEHPIITIQRAPAVQIEFTDNISEGDEFTDDDCSLFDGEGVLIAIKVCVARSQIAQGSFISRKPFRILEAMLHHSLGPANQLRSLHVQWISGR